MKTFFLTSAVFVLALSLNAQVSYRTGGSEYWETFDSLDGSFAGFTKKPWTDNATIPGWYASEDGYVAQGNPVETSLLYNFRVDGGSVNKSLGSVPGRSSGDIAFAVRLTNETGGELSSFRLQYTGEQWRNSGNESPSRMTVSYRIGGEELDGGSWVEVSGLEFSAMHTGGVAVNLAGKAAENRVDLGANVTEGFHWEPGEDLWIRWTHLEEAGANHALGVDDVRFVAGLTLGEPVVRGTWFWSQSGSGHPWGSAAVVGNAGREDDLTAILRGWEIGRIYGSYDSTLFANEPEAIANWNRKLFFNGIASWQLFSRTEWIFPDERESLRQRLANELTGFNAGRSAAEAFHGVHFDIEPHILADWKTATEGEKRDFLEGLVEMYEDVRAFLDANGGEELPVYAALPVWYAELPASAGGPGQVGWESTADRDGWFDRLAAVVDGIVMMAFETSSLTDVLATTAWERANFDGEVILALRVEGFEWNSFGEMVDAAHELEKATGRGIDIQPLHSLAQREAWRLRPAFEDWREAHFSGAELANPAVSGPAAEPAGDGFSNAYKYAFGFGPFDRVSGEQRFSLAPVEADGATESFPALRFFRLSGARDLVYRLEKSADLLEWTPVAGLAPTVLAGRGAGSEEALYVDPEPVSEADRRFFRVAVDRAVPVLEVREGFDGLDGAFEGTMLKPWVDDQTVPGWFASLTGYVASGNPTATSRMYNFRFDGSSTDMTLGSVPGGSSGDIHVAVRLANTTGETIDLVHVAYIGEQWRNSGNERVSELTVSYRIGGGAIDAGEWIAVPELSFAGPHFGAPVGNLNGKLGGNRRDLNGAIEGLEVPPGEELWIRWTHASHGGDNHALGIDAVEISAFSSAR